MNAEFGVLLLTAASIGFFHTLFGPDHYLPFVAMSRAGRWSLRKTLGITFLCGLGHVAGSVLLGAAGIALGLAVIKLEVIETYRGEVAAWALIAFGLVYLIWGIRRGIRNRPHTHVHTHEEGLTHVHQHAHGGDHAHGHSRGPAKSLTPWVLFTIFVFGPCEPLIPLLMYPAATQSLQGVVWVALVFSAVTIATMMSVVGLAFTGVRRISFGFLERFTHALAGGTVLACGLAIQFLGL